MTEEDAIKKSIRDYPDEDTPRLVYSDWLEEHGRLEQANFIREKRVGEHVGKLREAARNASGNTQYSTRRHDDIWPIANQARIAAFSGLHSRAANLHDEVGDWYYERTGGEVGNGIRHRNGAFAHYLAAHHNEMITHHLGSEAAKASDAALEATAATQPGYAPADQDAALGYYGHVEETAARAHRHAANLHRAEHNYTTAERHEKMADIHQQRADYYAQ